MVFMGNSKVESSYYLNHFPGWDYCEVPNHEHLNATDIRKILFPEAVSVWRLADITAPLDTAGRDTNAIRKELESVMPASSLDVIHVQASQNLEPLARVFDDILWAGHQALSKPQNSVLIEAHALAVQSGHILLYQRENAPGQGQWALPGGEIAQEETLEQAAGHRLLKLTGLDLPESEVRNLMCHAERRIFDAPGRSLFSRAITMAFVVQMPSKRTLHVVNKKAAWFPLANMPTEQMFEDHYGIIRNMLRV